VEVVSCPATRNVGISAHTLSAQASHEGGSGRTRENSFVREPLARVCGGVGAHEEGEDVARARARELLALRGLQPTRYVSDLVLARSMVQDGHGFGLALGDEPGPDPAHDTHRLIELPIARRRLRAS
jgi:hypothetical protein